jgi:hypothetical protein
VYLVGAGTEPHDERPCRSAAEPVARVNAEAGSARDADLFDHNILWRTWSLHDRIEQRGHGRRRDAAEPQPALARRCAAGRRRAPPARASRHARRTARLPHREPAPPHESEDDRLWPLIAAASPDAAEGLAGLGEEHVQLDAPSRSGGARWRPHDAARRGRRRARSDSRAPRTRGARPRQIEWFTRFARQARRPGIQPAAASSARLASPASQRSASSKLQCWWATRLNQASCPM